MLELDIPQLQQPITYSDKILLIGSCFTENMVDRLVQHKFKVLSNPHGILFNPLSVADSLNSYIDGKLYYDADLFQLNELWNSWEHHTRFSHIDKEVALSGINRSQEEAATFIKDAGWIVITLGSAFQYYLKENNRQVANNHRAPSQWFKKQLLSTDVIVQALSKTLDKLYAFNPNVQVLFTISPVRHIRDGVIENNRSKARLIEAVHTLCNTYKKAFYFPAYELIIDILRDYRYFDVDLVHPNYLATSYVWEQFVKSCMHVETQQTMKEIYAISIARSHKPRFPQTAAHQQFMSNYAAKVSNLIRQYPFIDLSDEAAYFGSDR